MSIVINLNKIRDLSRGDLSSLLEKSLYKNTLTHELETSRLAACCNAAKTALGIDAFDEQLMASAALYSSKIVEMKTGEGKTLSAVFAAFMLKCDGRRIHIFTFNDYLAKRDYNWMKPVYDLLGVKIALITEKTPFDERKKAYSDADVIYSTVKECGFDFLRDFMVFDPLYAADACHDFAIFDEADSVLIDEARTPLAIAGDVDTSVSDEFTEVFNLVKTFSESDYRVDLETMTVFLTELGAKKIEQHFGEENLYDEENIELRCNIDTSLKALFYLREDKDYIVRDNKIQLIDALSGRVAKHRLLPGALQSAVEAKHNLNVTSRGIVTGIVPIQFFARQYKNIAGMTGTAALAEDEFELLYGLEVEVIEPHTPSIRIDNPWSIYQTAEFKWKAIADRVITAHKKGQPVLIGTSSIEESEMLFKTLEKRLGENKENNLCNISVLNAKNDEMEADIIKNAGSLGAITVSTNMAGRGVDIKLGGFDEKSRDEVVKAGGLLVIGTALYENTRMNEQLNGRAGRQGDKGETELFISLEDEIMKKYNLKKLIGGDNVLNKLFKKKTAEDEPITDKKTHREALRIQRIAQGKLLGERKRLLRFTMIGEKHRDIIFNRRLDYISKSIDFESIWKAYSSDNYNKALELFSEGDLATFEREVILSSINEIWCDYLEYTSELRTGIHLRAVGGRNPSEEYNIECESYFEGAEGRLVDKVCDYLDILIELRDFEKLELFKPKNARTFLLEESGDELVRKPILLNVFNEDEDDSEE